MWPLPSLGENISVSFRLLRVPPALLLTRPRLVGSSSLGSGAASLAAFIALWRLLIDYVEKTSILMLRDNIGSLDNQLKVSVSLTSLLYCSLLTSVFGIFALLWILAIPSHLSVVGLGRCFCLLSPTDALVFGGRSDDGELALDDARLKKQ